MDSIQITGVVDNQHRLTADVPPTVQPGPITIWLAPAAQEDEADDTWSAGISHEWSGELSDVRQDIYSLSDGTAVDPA
jgi:hypothetical protein